MSGFVTLKSGYGMILMSGYYIVIPISGWHMSAQHIYRNIIQ